MSLALLFSIPLLWAQEVSYADLMQQARDAMIANDYASVTKLLDSAESTAPVSSALILQADLARLSFYRGVALWRQGQHDAAMEWWRKTLVISPGYQPENEILPEIEVQDVFYALAEEQKGKEQIVLGLPEDPGDTIIFVDGTRYEPLDSIYAGTHFIQMRCPADDTGESKVVGSWYTFGAPPPDYLVLCSGGSYPVADKKKTKAPKVEATKVETPKKESSGGSGGGNVGWILTGTGGALLLGGGVTNFLMVNPAWADAQAANADPGSVTADEADAIAGRFNTGRFATIGLVASGLVLSGTGVVLAVALDGGTVGLSPFGLTVRW